MDDNEFLQKVESLFGGRRDVYAVGYPDPTKANKYRYRREDGALDVSVWREHLKGEIVLGVYPLVDGKVNWFAVDFDAPKDDDGNVVANPFEAAWEAALAQKAAFEHAGLSVYLERSRSGTGVHVWGFLDAWMDAGLVRAALVPLLTDHETLSSRDRLYPVQPTQGTVEGLGNLLAMPFHGVSFKLGNSAFLDPGTQEVLNPREFVASARRVPVAVMTVLAAERRPAAASGGARAPSQGQQEFPREHMRGALKCISAYGSPFLRHCWESRATLPEPQWYAMLGACTMFKHGREFAHLMSRDYPKYRPAEVDEKYDHALQNPPVSCAYVAEQWPELACGPGPCALKFPHRHGQRGILELVGQSTEPMEAFGDATDDLAAIRRLDEGDASPGLCWGIPGLDDVMRLRRSELVVVGARPSMGKTAFMVHASRQLALQGIPTFVFSAETARNSLRQRYLSNAAEIDSRALRGERTGYPLTHEEYEALERGARSMVDLPLYLDFTTLSADQALRQVESMVLEQRIPLDSHGAVFFDYLQFGARVGGEDEYARISRLTTEFKFLPKILNWTMVLFSQLNRGAEGESAEDAGFDSFKGTGRIEEDADTAIIIGGERQAGLKVPRTIRITKQREGMANVSLSFDFWQAYGQWVCTSGMGGGSPAGKPFSFGESEDT